MIRAVVLAAVWLIPLALAGCAGLHEQPYTYTDDKEMSGRPGLFTGRTGAIVLFRDQGPPLLSGD